jgi:hypothetical protein
VGRSFHVIGPPIYGYIVRKVGSYGQRSAYQFQDNLEQHIRSKIIDEVQGRKVTMQESQLDACILQFKELGLLMFTEKAEEDGKVFRGVTLTELGERHLTRMNLRLREPKPPARTRKARH